MVVGDLEFDFIRKLAHDLAGFALGDNKRYLIETRLDTVLKSENLDSITSLVWLLQAKPRGPLHQQVVDALATNETWFFRDFHPFEALRKTVIPKLIQERQSQKTLSIWSAACATGQEPYSLAFLLDEFADRLKDWKIHLLATDMSQEVLNYAKKGTFKQIEVNRGLAAQHLVRYFDKTDGLWVVKPNYKKQITFRVMNLVQPWPPLPTFDIVLLRNVLIYFGNQQRNTMIANLRRVIHPDGFLMLGAVEAANGMNNEFELEKIENTMFYRPSTPADAPAWSFEGKPLIQPKG